MAAICSSCDPSKFNKVSPNSLSAKHQWVLKKKKKCISFLFSFISGNMGRSPTPWGREWRKCQCWSERTGGISVSWWLPHWSEEGTWAGMAPPLRHHARKPSPLQTSRWSSGCPGSWANIGPKVLKAPNTPAVRGRKKIKKIKHCTPPPRHIYWFSACWGEDHYWPGWMS